MKKDSFYFPHFYNARHDRKIRRVRKELGVEGYGIYFMLLEILREQIDFKYPLSDVDLLADEFGTSIEKVKTVISKYDLFQMDESQMFFSLKMIFYLQPYIEKSERGRNAANKRWDKVKCDANALQMQSKCNASQNASKVKERKTKERKVFIKPTLAQIKTYCEEKKSIIDPEIFFHNYESTNWIKTNGQKVMNWKSTLITWEKRNQNDKGNNNGVIAGLHEFKG